MALGGRAFCGFFSHLVASPLPATQLLPLPPAPAARLRRAILPRTHASLPFLALLLPFHTSTPRRFAAHSYYTIARRRPTYLPAMGLRRLLPTHAARRLPLFCFWRLRWTVPRMRAPHLLTATSLPVPASCARYFALLRARFLPLPVYTRFAVRGGAPPVHNAVYLRFSAATYATAHLPADTRFFTSLCVRHYAYTLTCHHAATSPRATLRGTPRLRWVPAATRFTRSTPYPAGPSWRAADAHYLTATARHAVHCSPAQRATACCAAALSCDGQQATALLPVVRFTTRHPRARLRTRAT